MSKSTLISVLDVGTTKSCILVSQVDNEGYHIVGYGISPSSGMKKGTVVDIDKVSESISNALQNAEKICESKIKEITIGVTGEHIYSVVNRGEIEITSENKIISESDIEKVIKRAGNYGLPRDKELLHTIPRYYIVDGIRNIDNPIGMRGEKLGVEATLVIGNMSHIQNLITATENAGLKVKNIMLQPYASGKAVLTEKETAEGVCLIDIGGGTTDVAVFKDGALYSTFVVPVGGNHITNDLSLVLNLSFDEAEKLKIEYGGCDLLKVNRDEMINVSSKGKERQFSKQLVFEIIEARVMELFSYVNALLHKLDLTLTIPSGIVITGGTSLLKDIDVVAEREFGIPVRIGYPRDLDNIWETLNSPVYGTALGLLRLEISEMSTGKAEPDKGNLFNYLVSKVKRWFQGLFEE